MYRLIAISTIWAAIPAATALAQQVPWAPGPMPVELSTSPDLGETAGGGGPLALSIGQVLYTESIDLVGPPNPINTAVVASSEVDAVANIQDRYYYGVINNVADLYVSFLGDSLYPPPNPQFDHCAAYVEKPSGACRAEVTHRDLYVKTGGGPGLVDVDGLEMWGGTGTTDAELYSLVADNLTGTSVWVDVGGVPTTYIPKADIENAVISLGYTGALLDVDVDAVMVADVSGNNVWETEDEIIFSIRAAGGWHGGELVRLINLGGGQLDASFLVHGGHTWDNTWDPSTCFPNIANIEVDGIEAVPRERHWDNVDLTNNMAATDAFDVTVILAGVHTILNHFDGKPLGALDEGYFDHFSVEYIIGPNTKLRWWGFHDSVDDAINPGQTIHVGWVTKAPHAVIAMYWTDINGNQIGEPIPIIKPQIDMGPGGELSVVWVNVFGPPGSTPGPIQLSNIVYAAFDDPIPLEELVGTNAALEEAFAQNPTLGDLTVGPEPEQQFLPSTIDPGKALVMKFEASAETTGAHVVDYHQAMVPPPCFADKDCYEMDVCTLDECVESECVRTPNTYGDIDANGILNIFDLFCVLDGFSGDFTTCTLEQDDIHGSCGVGGPDCCPNGLINVFDLFAVLNGFQGIDPCCSPHPASPRTRSIGARNAPGDRRVRLFLETSERRPRAGDLASVRVYLSGSANLRGYQLAPLVSSGETVIQNLRVPDRDEQYPFLEAHNLSATDSYGARLVAFSVDTGADVGGRQYLGAFDVRLPESSPVKVQISLDPEGTILLDDRGRVIESARVLPLTLFVR